MYFFFFNDTATTEIYPLPLHDALPISGAAAPGRPAAPRDTAARVDTSRVRKLLKQRPVPSDRLVRSEEHTSELQSLAYLVCRLLLEKKKIKIEICIISAYQYIDQSVNS